MEKTKNWFINNFILLTIFWITAGIVLLATNQMWDWLVLGTIATWVTAAGLFVAIWQIREVSKGQAGNTIQSVIDASYALERLYIEYPNLYHNMQCDKKIIDDHIATGKLTDHEKIQLEWLTFMTLDFFDNLLYQKNLGLIKPNSEVWLSWERSIIFELKHCPYLSQMLKEYHLLYTPELSKFLPPCLQLIDAITPLTAKAGILKDGGSRFSSQAGE